MMTQAALKKCKGESVKVLVSEAHARSNVEKYGKAQRKEVTVTSVGNDFEIVLE